MAFSCSCRTSSKLNAVPGQRRPMLFLISPRRPTVACSQLRAGEYAAARWSGACQCQADLTKLFCIELRQPAPQCRSTQIHIPADIEHAQVLHPDHLGVNTHRRESSRTGVDATGQGLHPSTQGEDTVIRQPQPRSPCAGQAPWCGGFRAERTWRRSRQAKRT